MSCVHPGDGKSDAKAADGKDKASAAAAAASSDNGTDPIVHEAGAVENVQVCLLLVLFALRCGLVAYLNSVARFAVVDSLRAAVVDRVGSRVGCAGFLQRTFRWFEEKAEWAALPAEKKAEA